MNKEEKKKKKEKIKKRKKIIKIITIIAIILFSLLLIYSVFKIINWSKDNKNTNEQTKEITENTEIIEIQDNENTENINPPEDEFDPYWDYIKIPLINVDFKNLKKQNPDTVGWISVDETNINYPVVQASNNDYYLNHSFDETWNDAGWIYMDYRNNSKDFDKNTIIYGHSRYDKSMFGSLRNITKKSWYDNKSNHIIKFSTPTENTLWQVFSTYTIKAESYYITTDFENDQEYTSWLNTIKNRTQFNYNTTVTKDDKVLTLSSCYTSDGIRVVLHAKLIKKEAR